MTQGINNLVVNISGYSDKQNHLPGTKKHFESGSPELFFRTEVLNLIMNNIIPRQEGQKFLQGHKH